MRLRIYAGCASTVTFHANILVNCESGKPTHKSMLKFEFKRLNNLRSFGEIVVVTTMNKIQGKLRDLDTVCMFLGYLQT
jgi:hypothetical protein